MLSDQLTSTIGGNSTISVAVPAPKEPSTAFTCIKIGFVSLWFMALWWVALNRNKCVDAWVSGLQRQSSSWQTIISLRRTTCNLNNIYLNHLLLKVFGQLTSGLSQTFWLIIHSLISLDSFRMVWVTVWWDSSKLMALTSWTWQLFAWVRLYVNVCVCVCCLCGKVLWITRVWKTEMGRTYGHVRHTVVWKRTPT